MTEAIDPPDPGAEMLERHLQGDPRAFSELVGSFGAGLWGYLRHCGLKPEEADDLFQETFLRVHRSAHSFDRTYPFKAWLLAIARNLVRSELRKKKVRRIIVSLFRHSRTEEMPKEAEPADPAPGPEARLEARQAMEELERRVTSLPANQRDALLLVCVHGLSVEQAARALHVPTATLKTWLRRARLKLLENSAAGGGEGT